VESVGEVFMAFSFESVTGFGIAVVRLKNF
jgi:hypothetical protein